MRSANGVSDRRALVSGSKPSRLGQLAHFHNERTHQWLGNRPPLRQEAAEPVEPLDTGQIVCRERLGGLLKHYERRVA